MEYRVMSFLLLVCLPFKPVTSFSKTEHVLPLQVMSVRTSGSALGTTIITITYGATLNHTTEWCSEIWRGGMLRTAGKREQDTYISSIYTSTVDVPQLGNMYNLYFRLHSDDESVNLKLNVTALKTKQEALIKPPASGFLKMDRRFVAPTDTALEITGILNRTLNDFPLSRINLWLIGINTSASPPSVFKHIWYDFNRISVGVSSTSNSPTSCLRITIKYPYVQYGGILTVGMNYPDSDNSLVEQLNYGPQVQVFSHDGMNVFRENTIALYPLQRQTILYQPSSSISCIAVGTGNPRPDVSIWKVTKGGKEKEMVTETIVLDSYINSQALTLSPDHPKETEGRYICRATNGNQSVEATTEAVVHEPAVIESVYTGVTKITKRIVISCKASGKPMPNLELRLYNFTGPDLTKTGLYKVKRSYQNKYTTRVTLTFSPVDYPDIHTVICEAPQEGHIIRSRVISVYPGMKKEDNAELYRRLQDAVEEADLRDV